MAKPRADMREVAARVQIVKSLLTSGTPAANVIDWCMTETVGDRERGIEPKPWKVSRQSARKYIDRALEQIGAEDGQPIDRKRARNRALTTMIVQRLMAQGSTSALIGALKGADQLCKIDGSYDPNMVGGNSQGINPATPEDAAMLIEHAHATLALARARGQLQAAPAAPVIDVESTEVEDSETEIDDEHPTRAN